MECIQNLACLPLFISISCSQFLSYKNRKNGFDLALWVCETLGLETPSWGSLQPFVWKPLPEEVHKPFIWEPLPEGVHKLVVDKLSLREPAKLWLGTCPVESPLIGKGMLFPLTTGLLSLSLSTLWPFCILQFKIPVLICQVRSSRNYPSCPLPSTQSMQVDPWRNNI